MTTKIVICVTALWLTFVGVVANAADSPPPKTDNFKSFEETRTKQYADQLEAWLRDWLVNQYPQRANKAWHRAYSRVEAFMASV